MKRKTARILLTSLGLLACVAAAGGDLSVDQILERYVAARGGAAAWHKLQTMAWTGHIESGPGGTSKVPFLMMFRRPGATRFDVFSQGQHSVRGFDGRVGWKLAPAADGVPNLTDYSAEENTFARDAAGLDGPLFDPKAKGVNVVLQGTGSVEGHDAFHLKVTLPSGQVHDDWIDAHSFLELRYDRPLRNANGSGGIVSVYYRNYQTIGDLVIPLVIETGNPASKKTDTMIIEKVALNPVFESAQFAKPAAPPQKQHRGVVINTESAAAGHATKP